MHKHAIMKYIYWFGSSFTYLKIDLGHFHVEFFIFVVFRLGLLLYGTTRGIDKIEVH